MADMKKYHDIVRLGHKSTVDVLHPGDNIVVQEKIDGANASFKRDGDKLLCFSRNTLLDESNGLRGFYHWTQTNVNVHQLVSTYIYFGEWLVQHKVQYRPDAMQQFYLFDVYDTVTEKYLPFDVVGAESRRIGLNLINVMYRGPYQGFEHLQSFVGQSAYGDTGEGIVVKNVDYVDRYGHQLFVKLVSDKFAEVQHQKLPRDPNKPATPEQEFVNTYMTQARVDKLIGKLIDEGVLDGPFLGMEDMGAILRNLNKRVYDDLMKEESDSLPDGYDDKALHRAIGHTLPTIVKSIIKSRDKGLI